MTKHSTTTLDQKQSFARWLEGQLTFRKWKAADLARQSNLSISTISLLLHAHRAPEPVSCKKLASGLGLPVDLVYEKAGYMSGSETLSSPKRSLIEFVKRMPDADALKLLARSQARMVVTQADGKWWA